MSNEPGTIQPITPDELKRLRNSIPSPNPARPVISIRRMRETVKMPILMLPHSVGVDVYAYLLSETGRPSKAIVPPRTTRAIPTGIIVSPPPGHAIFVCSRSGLAQHSIFVTNAPGVIDPDYRGELMVLVYNGGHETYYVQHEDRVAQLVVLPCISPVISEVPSLALHTERGAAGFGSTGR